MTYDNNESPARNTDHERLARQLSTLKLAVGALSVAWVALAAWVVLVPRALPSVVAVERLDIVEPDGSLAFVLAGSAHPQPALIGGQPIMGGQEIERRHPTLLFFDGQGDEVGGLTFSTEASDAGQVVQRHLSLDAYRQDESVVLLHRQSPQGAESGLVIFDRPRDVGLPDAFEALGTDMGATREELEAAIAALEPETMGPTLGRLFGVQRMFVGSDADDRAGIVMLDGQNRVRVELVAPASGEPVLRFLDEGGEVVLELPEV